MAQNEQTKLRMLMIKRGITHTALAKELGLTKYGMSKKMCGKNPFTWDEVCVVCEILGIDNPIGVIEPRKERTRCP